MPSQEPPTPLGIKIVAVWAAITGIALLVLGFARTPWYLPLGVLTLVSAYGLWHLQMWGLVLVAIALSVEIFLSVMEGTLIELAVVLLVLAYLYTQLRYFPRLSLPSITDWSRRSD